MGANTAIIKVDEAREAIVNWATELDMAINIGVPKSGFPEHIGREIDAVLKAAGGIRRYRDAKAMLEAGASRLGTSATIEILSEIED